MKAFIALVLILVFGIGGGLFYTVQQSAEQRRWAASMHNYMGQLTEYQRASEEGLRNDADVSQRAVRNEISQLKSMVEGLSLAVSSQAERDEATAEAEEDLNRAREAVDGVDESKLSPEVKEIHDAIRDQTPQDIINDPEKARQRAKQLRDHYDKIVLDLRDRKERRQALREKLDYFIEIEPRTPEIEREIEKIKREIEEIDKEIERLEEKRRQTKLVLDVLKALLRMAAMLSFASGNVAQGAALMQMAGLLEGVGGEGEGEPRERGGYLPQPPPPPGPGGDEQGQGGDTEVVTTPPPNEFDLITGSTPGGVQLMTKDGAVYAANPGETPVKLFTASANTIKLIEDGTNRKINIGAKRIELETGGSGYIISADSNGEANVQQVLLGDPEAEG